MARIKCAGELIFKKTRLYLLVGMMLPEANVRCKTSSSVLSTIGRPCANLGLPLCSILVRIALGFFATALKQLSPP